MLAGRHGPPVPGRVREWAARPGQTWTQAPTAAGTVQRAIARSVICSETSNICRLAALSAWRSTRWAGYRRGTVPGNSVRRCQPDPRRPGCGAGRGQGDLILAAILGGELSSRCDEKVQEQHRCAGDAGPANGRVPSVSYLGAGQLADNQSPGSSC